MSSEPLSYHVKIRDFFKGQSDTWSFFSAPRQREEQLTDFKTELLKNTCPFHPESDPILYEKIHMVLEKLGLNGLRVTVYQALTNDPELDASIVCLPGEAHMVLSGGVLQILDEKELVALMAHELAHVKFNSLQEGELETTGRIIMAIANNPDSSAAQYETARLFGLYTEIYCDRAAYAVSGDEASVSGMLQKMATELAIRTSALALGSGPGADAAIAQMIGGVTELDRLDILAQQELSVLTEKLLQYYLRPEWFRTAPVMSLAAQYFPAFKIGEGGIEPLKSYLTGAHGSIREYFAYVLLDFALADPDLEDVPAGYALQVAEACGIPEVFETVIKKELSYSDKQWDRQRLQMSAAYASLKEA